MAAALLSGCTTMFGGLAAPRGEALNVAAAAGEAATPPATVQVVLKSTSGKTKQTTLPLTAGMSVQTALEQTGAIRKFTDMDIKVYRITPQSKGAVVPLQAEYDPAKNRVPILHDMALHPGDKVLVSENENSQIDLMIGKLTGHGKQRRGLE